MNSFYTKDELMKLGFSAIGENVLISKKASIYGASNISIGSNIRIDDFCILSGRIVLGDNIHISAYSAMFAGEAGIVMKDFTGLSSRCVIYAISDDYSGEVMTNAVLPDKYRRVRSEQVMLERHVIVGSGCTILPGVTIGEGAAVGSMSLVNQSLEPWAIYAGIPCHKIKERSNRLLELEEQYLSKKNIERNR